jgi:hypothetical protein
MKKQLLSGALSIIMLGVLVISSCTKEASDVAPGANRVTIGNTENSCVTLIAGRNINAGTVCFEDEDTDGDGYVDLLRVCYNTIDGWELTEAHLFIGNSMAEIPMTRSGNPIPGQFPYKSGDITGLTTYCFEIPFSEIGMVCPNPGKNYVVAAHCAMRKPNGTGGYQTETGWGAGERINTKGSWGTYFEIVVSCDERPPVSTCSETAFAMDQNGSAICFSEFGEFVNNPNRWGWTNGPLVEGDYTFELWAGAGQCNLSNGARVGELVVRYRDGIADVTYNVFTPYSLKEVHLYVGNNPLATSNNGPHPEYTLAPGQYPIVSGLLGEGTTDANYVVENLSGEVYVVAHASVYGFECE